VNHTINATPPVMLQQYQLHHSWKWQWKQQINNKTINMQNIRCKQQIGKASNIPIWKRKLITSIPTNPTWRPQALYRGRSVSAMFPIIALHLPGPCQQVASLSHIASWGSYQRN